MVDDCPVLMSIIESELSLTLCFKKDLEKNFDNTINTDILDNINAVITGHILTVWL